MHAGRQAARRGDHPDKHAAAAAMATNSQQTAPGVEMSNQQQLEREIHSMVSSITGHLTTFARHAPAGAAGGGDDDGGGMRIITLAGNNKGATMEGADGDDAHGVVYGGDDGQLTAFANSNYQAVNNSILLGGSCTAEDPGVHLVITEFVVDDDDDGAGRKAKREADEGEKKAEKKA